MPAGPHRRREKRDVSFLGPPPCPSSSASSSSCGLPSLVVFSSFFEQGKTSRSHDLATKTTSKAISISELYTSRRTDGDGDDRTTREAKEKQGDGIDITKGTQGEPGEAALAAG
ncbi:uncharacterized protein ARB_07531 [Trichophyton benhamiae CBS 112371]|uniref:Uncharacterized protein n=1 Tax=Arthroderma benhamiae (strain ATCC MYA-4681 / CBS 112371) TaxID=663331 RepID=D4ATG7_ARTBC|nr:uncharacterized protein ARB_07531 [Trichophyton benhamiae CBS 112371]EFE33586.1 hypothetical protein ARB_07531 [Trichophyton benhamiae CBS 112371]